jgi:hypothetical protein
MQPIPLTQVKTEPNPMLAEMAELRREKHDLEMRLATLEREPDSIRAAAQNFFSLMYAETRRPHFGEQAKQWTASMLIRATEAGLYTPEDR